MEPPVDAGNHASRKRRRSIRKERADLYNGDSRTDVAQALEPGLASQQLLRRSTKRAYGKQRQMDTAISVKYQSNAQASAVDRGSYL